MRRLCKRFGAGLLLCILLLTGACGAADQTQPRASTARDDMRAVWVSTVYNLDYPNQPTSDAQALQSQADTILQNCKDMGMNAVILQVRPCSDAFYPSDLFPWSSYLTGGQDTAPSGGFDPLEYWVEKAHALGLELHAWINPFRVTRDGQQEYDRLSASSPAKEHPEWVVEDGGNYYLDPGLPQVRELVIQGAEEIVRNYDVDGIHLDDYFYPSTTFDDGDTFAQYGGDFSDIGDWRRDNVNQLIQQMDTRLHALDTSISFGVSPAGVWANKSSLAEGSDTRGNETYFSHYADTRKWVKEQWLDYICPQIYWYIGHPAADYETLVNWWADVVQGTGVRLYIGMADYQAGNEDPSSPWYGTAAIEQQLALNRSTPEVAGEMHFRYRFLAENQALADLYRQQYGQNGGAETPETPEQPETPSEEPEDPTVEPQLNREEHLAYIEGDGLYFRPGDPLTRAEAVAMLARLSVDSQGNDLFQSGQDYACTFADVDPDKWYAPYVGFAQQYNIVGGYEDGTFRPEQGVTRAELVRILANYCDISGGSLQFPDVPEGYWAAEAIAYAADQGWIGGYEDGTFRPAQAVTRAEAVRILNGALGRQPDEEAIDQVASVSPFADVSLGHWAYYEILEASQSHDFTQERQGERWTL